MVRFVSTLTFIKSFSKRMETFANLTKEDVIAKYENLLKENEVLKNNLKQYKEPLGGSPSNGNPSLKNNNLKKRPLNISKSPSSENPSLTKNNPKKVRRPFNFSKYRVNRVAFKFLYFGWDYSGFAGQENTTNTVENQLFDALIKSKLIENRASSNYSRCGRTDKGVSAFSQVIALDVRSNFLRDEDVGSNPKKVELPYVKILNRSLPPDIRVYACAAVDETFDARFTCSSRTYKYFFPSGNLDIEAMRAAATKLIGEHDFRNFCKVDVGNNVNHFIRRITNFQINKVNEGFGYALYELEITGLAFLWHQVRCMAAVLLLVGMRHETPDIIDHLLDIDKCPKRPQFGLASEIPLVLFGCDFPDVQWSYEEDANEYTVNKLLHLWATKYIQAASVSSMIEHLMPTISTSSLRNIASTVLPSHTDDKNYKKLRSRAVCDGLERHLERQAVKRLKLEEKYLKKQKNS